MCDVRLFRSAFIDFLTAKQLYEPPIQMMQCISTMPLITCSRQ